MLEFLLHSIGCVLKIECNVGCVIFHWNLDSTQPSIQCINVTIHYSELLLQWNTRASCFITLESAMFCNPSDDMNITVRTTSHIAKMTTEYELWLSIAHTMWLTWSISSIYLQTWWKWLQARSIHSGGLMFLKQLFDVHLPMLYVYKLAIAFCAGPCNWAHQP